MSGLAAIVRFDGGAVEATALTEMIEALAHRGAEPPTSWRAGPVGLAHRQRRTTFAAREEVQPRVDPSGRASLVLDGRVDDRASLLAALGPDRELLRDSSDAELVLRAYLRWGRAAFGRIVGDFAVVVWDGARQELVAARDPLAQRPLVYLRDRRPDGDALRIASEVTALLADRHIRRAPNPGMVAEHLAVRVTSTTETFFAGVFRVPPGHALIARLDGTVALEATWTWDRDAARPRSGTTDAQAAAHVEELRELLHTTVRAHLDTPDPVAAELSGGIDSSSVVGVAVAELRAAGRPMPELFSLVLPGHRYDESEFIREVASFVGLRAREHEPQPRGEEHYEAEIRRTLLPPGPPNLAMLEANAVAARDQGSRVLLSGHGGDEWLTGSRYALADDLRGRRLRGLRARARDDRTLWPARTPVHHLVRDGLLPALGRPVDRPPAVDALPPRFRAEVGLDERLRWRPSLAGPSVATAHVASLLGHGQTIYEREQLERASAAWGIERRSPLDDRRIVELALRLPDDVRRRGTATKWVLRMATEGVVPDAVRHRGWKTGFGDVLMAELRGLGGPAALSGLAIEELGWVDADVLRRAWGAPGGRAGDRPAYGLAWASWNALWTDRWYRATFCA